MAGSAGHDRAHPANGKTDGPTGSPPGTGKLALGMALLVLAGGPLVFVLWEAVNALLAGRPERIRPDATLAALAAFAVYLAVLARIVTRWTGGDR